MNTIPQQPYYGAQSPEVYAPQGGYYQQPGTLPWQAATYQQPGGVIPPQNTYGVRNGNLTGINYLSDEELKALEQKKHEVWSISPEQAARSKCTHKAPQGRQNAGQMDGYFKQGENLWHCNTCNQDFHFVDAPQKDIEETINFVLDVMDTTKFMWLAPPKDVVDQFYPIMDWVAKIPDAYRLAKQQWESKNQISKLYTAGNMYAPPAYGNQTYGGAPASFSSDYAPTGVPVMMPYQQYYAQPQYGQQPYGQPPQQYGQQAYNQQYGGYQQPNNANPLVQAQAAPPTAPPTYPQYQQYPAAASQIPGTPGSMPATAPPPPANPYGIPPETSATAQAPAQQPAPQTPPANTYIPAPTGTPDVSTMTTSTTTQTI